MNCANDTKIGLIKNEFLKMFVGRLPTSVLAIKENGMFPHKTNGVPTSNRTNGKIVASLPFKRLSRGV